MGEKGWRLIPGKGGQEPKITNGSEVETILKYLVERDCL